LAALLAHDAPRSPCRQRVVETFVGSTYGLIIREGHPSVIETGQIAHPVIGGSGHDPGIAAITQYVSESVVVLKEEDGLGGQRSARRGPVHGIRGINVKVRDDRTPLQLHVGRRREVGLLDVLQIIDQCLLRRAARTGKPLNRALVDHDREGEAGMAVSLGHDKFCSIIDAIVRAVPIENDALDSTADHVGDLIVDLRRVGGIVAHVHVVRASEP
jgi:hypothetical protein